VKVLVVVLNYRTPDLAIRCLESLEHEVGQTGAMHVVVPDNASGDGSVAKIGAAIEQHQWDWCTLLPLPENGGYCFGNNAGIRPYLSGNDSPDYVMLVNPDAYIRQDAVTHLLRFMDAHPEVGIAGSRLEDPDGTQHNGAFRFPSAITELIDGFRFGPLSAALKRHDLRYELGEQPMTVDWVVGASMMIRREVFEEVGLLDEAYFLYFDEVDFCLRARRAGWLCYYVPQSVVVHLVGQATGISDTRKKPPRYPEYWFYSRRRFYVKNYGKLHAVAADLAFLAGYTTFRIRRVIQDKPDWDPPRFWIDFVRNSTLAKGFRL
jgi:N-acetylglucosaminyl-diphospho-decaprenol L-rhamnosyltransferase